MFIGLGSNLGNRREYLRSAERKIREHPDMEHRASSSVLETPPAGKTDQPAFLNQVIAVRTGLPPEGLLTELHRIEDALGRERGERWGPRTIDLDILLHGDSVVETPRVRIPHPRLRERLFFVSLLVELDPGVMDPETGKTWREHLDEELRGRREEEEVASLGVRYRGDE